MTGEIGWIYTLHLHMPLGRGGRNGARHYTGWAADHGGAGLVARLVSHRLGKGARMMAWCAAHEVGWHVGALQRGTRDDERRLKQHGASRRCWTCRYAAAAR